MTAGGFSVGKDGAASPSAQINTAKAAIKNAVLGLVVVVAAYVMVSFIIEMSGRFQGTPSASPLDDAAFSQTNQNTGLTPTNVHTTPTQQVPQTAASSSAACRAFYQGDPATCFLSGGPCPHTANAARNIDTLDRLLNAWTTRLPTSGGTLPQRKTACGTCIGTEVQSTASRYPGLDTTCIPADVSAWNGRCRAVCSSGTSRDEGTSVDAATPTEFETCVLDCAERKDPSHDSTLTVARLRSQTAPNVYICRAACMRLSGQPAANAAKIATFQSTRCAVPAFQFFARCTAAAPAGDGFAASPEACTDAWTYGCESTCPTGRHALTDEQSNAYLLAKFPLTDVGLSVTCRACRRYCLTHDSAAYCNPDPFSLCDGECTPPTGSDTCPTGLR
jgi:hypothetical protein